MCPSVLPEARSIGGLIGFTGAYAHGHRQKKPPHLMTKKTSPKMMNRPRPYAVMSAHGHVDKINELLSMPTYQSLMGSMQTLVTNAYPGLVRFLHRVIPKERRLWPDQIWTQVAMTGGTFQGYCRKHVDGGNLLNGLFYVSGGTEVCGGHTVVFEKENDSKQAFALKFKNGRCVLGPFRYIYHAATAYTGGRCILGAYVDKRIVDFCLSHTFVAEDQPWKVRPVEECESLTAEFDALCEEYNLVK